MKQIKTVSPGAASITFKTVSPGANTKDIQIGTTGSKI